MPFRPNEPSRCYGCNSCPRSLSLSFPLRLFFPLSPLPSQPGGLNFDAKIRRESTDIEDLFIGHINGMDCYARGLRAAAKLIADGKLDAIVKERYATFDKGLGAKFANGKASLSELASYAAKSAEPKQSSGKQEKLESLFNRYAYGS